VTELIPHYMNQKGVAKVGDLVMGPGNVRALVLKIEGTFVKIIGIGVKRETGEVTVLQWVTDCPASECVLLESQTLTLAEK
jgi:hypothetical protein